MSLIYYMLIIHDQEQLVYSKLRLRTYIGFLVLHFDIEYTLSTDSYFSYLLMSSLRRFSFLFLRPCLRLNLFLSLYFFSIFEREQKDL